MINYRSLRHEYIVSSNCSGTVTECDVSPRTERRCGPPRLRRIGAVAHGAEPIGAGSHSANGCLALGVTVAMRFGGDAVQGDAVRGDAVASANRRLEMRGGV